MESGCLLTGLQKWTTDSRFKRKHSLSYERNSLSAHIENSFMVTLLIFADKNKSTVVNSQIAYLNIHKKLFKPQQFKSFFFFLPVSQNYHCAAPQLLEATCIFPVSQYSTPQHPITVVWASEQYSMYECVTCVCVCVGGCTGSKGYFQAFFI